MLNVSIAGHAGWPAYDTFFIVLLSSWPVNDSNPLRPNPNSQKLVSCSCRVCRPNFDNPKFYSIIYIFWIIQYHNINWLGLYLSMVVGLAIWALSLKIKFFICIGSWAPYEIDMWVHTCEMDVYVKIWVTYTVTPEQGSYKALLFLGLTWGLSCTA